MWFLCLCFDFFLIVLHINPAGYNLFYLICIGWNPLGDLTIQAIQRMTIIMLDS